MIQSIRSVAVRHEMRCKGVSLIKSKWIKRMILSFLFCFLCLGGSARLSAVAANVVKSAPKAAEGKWKTSAEGRRYRYTKSRKYAKDTWLNIDGAVYRFDENGYVQTGWITFNGKRYYAGSDGGLYVSRWVKKNKKYYYLLSNGTLAKKRMVKYKKKWYYVDEAGVRVTNAWITVDGKKYYFGWDGVRLQNSWVKNQDNGKLYYMGSSGAMAVKQWVTVTDRNNNKSYYYVGANGVRKTNCVVQGYYLDSSGRRTVKVFQGDYIFVGDSRTVGMQMAVSPSDTKYIAKVAMGYVWLAQTAGPMLKEYLNANPDVSVILALGINDLGNVRNYIAYYKKLIAKYPKTRFFVLSVNPVNEALEAAHGYTVKNSQITAFNKAVKAEVGKSRYLNTYQYLKKKGFQSSDGLHYTTSVYADLYNYIIKKIRN